MEDIVLPMLTLVRLEHPARASSPIAVTPVGKDTDDSELQPAKALLPTTLDAHSSKALVTEYIYVMAEQPSKACSPIEVT